MFERILVPIDRTARADEALEAARRLARCSGAGLVLVGVEEPAADADRLSRAHQELDRRVRELREQGVEARCVLGYGRADRGIAEAVEAAGADLVVMAPHRRGGLEALTHPSTTAETFARSTAPILVWPEQAPGRALAEFLNVPGAAVIVALDGGVLAERAVPFAEVFAREYARPLLLVTVVKPITVSVGGPAAIPLQRESRKEQERQARHYLHDVRTHLLGDGLVGVESMVLQGQPARELVRLAETHGGSLLVLGTHGRGTTARLLMGSVVARLMGETPLPLLVVPPHAGLPASRVRTAGDGPGTSASDS